MKPFVIILLFSLLFVSCKEKKDSEESITGIPIDGDGKIYASPNYEEVESFAKSLDSSVKIMVVQSKDVRIDGSSKSWTYEFVSTDKKILYYFNRTYLSIGFDSTGNIRDGNSVITKTWIKSNEALTAAEKYGGKSFRESHGSCQISALLSEPLIPNSVPLWYIKYLSSTEHLYVIINGITGEFYSN